MPQLVRIPLCALAAGFLLAASGCVVAPGHDHYRGYEHRDDAYRYGYDRDADQDRYRDRREEYERCREQGGRDCDDILHR